MDSKNVVATVACVAACAAAAWLFAQNRALRREIGEMREERAAAELQRPKMKAPPRPSQPIPSRPEEFSGPDAPEEDPSGGETLDAARIDDALKERMAEMRKRTEEARARRRDAIAALTPEQKEEQREAFIGKMRERAQKRFNTFVSNTGLDDEQTESFRTTVATLDSNLRETAEAWAENIRETGTFTRDSQMTFAGHISLLVSAGYDEMDATLPEDWRETEGDVNLMEIVGPEAMSPMVEALTETGNDDGLQVIGQIMSGPGGEGGGGGEAPEGLDGIESPGVGDGPGGMNGSGGSGDQGGPGGPGGPGE